jgi:hypothetical protein
VYDLNKQFIDEKVLQHYYFEKFLRAGREQRRKLLPEGQPFEKYRLRRQVKILQPEVKIADGFNVDFILYPPTNQSEYIYIEMKFRLAKLNTPSARNVRHPLLRQNNINGKDSAGFAVVLNDDCPTWPDDIPVVKLDMLDFAQWYLDNSIKMIDQLRSKLAPDVKDIRRRQVKNWVVQVGGQASKNYDSGALSKGKWAFKDGKDPKQYLQMERGDNVVFVRYSMIGGEFNNPRQIYAHGVRGKPDFKINRVDVFQLTKGYETDFDTDYFETDDWKALPSGSIADSLHKYSQKKYTQFVTFNPRGEGNYTWNRGGASLYRASFSSREPYENEFINALRQSQTTQGKPHEISDLCLRHLKAKLG